MCKNNLGGVVAFHLETILPASLPNLPKSFFVAESLHLEFIFSYFYALLDVIKMVIDGLYMDCGLYMD